MTRDDLLTFLATALGVLIVQVVRTRSVQPDYLLHAAAAGVIAVSLLVAGRLALRQMKRRRGRA